MSVPIAASFSREICWSMADVSIRADEFNLDLRGIRLETGKESPEGQPIQLQVSECSWSHPRIRPGSGSLAAHLRLTADAVRIAELLLDAALNDGWLRVNTLELNALRSHAIVTVAAVRWSDVLTGRTGRLLVELTAEFSLSSEDLPSLLSFAGVIVPGEAEFNIPLAERFFNGGENTVRSFKESELGPVGMAY